MVSILIQMKLAALRRSMTSERAAWEITGGGIGLILAAGTVLLSTMRFDDPSVVIDLLGLVFALWTLGWVVGPVWVGGESILRADHFALLPIPRYRLAIGLLGAAFVGVTTAVTLLAFTSLVVYAARLGVESTLIAVPVVALHLVFVVLLSRVGVSLFGAAMRSRLGSALTAVMLAAMLVVAQSGWMVYVAIQTSGALTRGFPPEFSMVVRALPSSWGLVAVDAAGRADWLQAALALAGLILLTLFLLGVWSWRLGAPRTAQVTVRGPRGRANETRTRIRRARRLRGTATVVVKELRAWWRDPLRTFNFSVAAAWALITCLLPVTFGATTLLPWAAPAIILMATVTSANLYGQDGSALWLTLLMPRAERYDVRGRQWAWLLVFGPIALATAFLLTALSGLDWAWPWVLAVLPALLGAGAGLVVWTSVMAPTPGPDPCLRRDSPLDHGDASGVAIMLFWIGLLPAVPAIAVVAAGALLDNDLLRWAGIPVGIATGVFLAWWLGRIAYRRLQTCGPEMLYLLRARKPSRAKTGQAQPSVVDAMSRKQRIIFTLCVSLGWLPLFPQGLAPLGIKLAGAHETRVWFLALYLPEAWQWPTIAFMIALGLLTYGVAVRLYWAHNTHRRLTSASPQDSARA